MGIAEHACCAGSRIEMVRIHCTTCSATLNAACLPRKPSQFNFAFNAEDEKNSLALRFARRTDTMPQPPKVGRRSLRPRLTICVAPADTRQPLAIPLIPRPSASQATKHHPSSVDLELIKRLASSTAASSLTSFLSKEFDCIPRDLAGESASGWVGKATVHKGAALPARHDWSLAFIGRARYRLAGLWLLRVCLQPAG